MSVYSGVAEGLRFQNFGAHFLRLYRGSVVSGTEQH